MEQELYPLRVTRGPDGVYRWRARLTREVNMQTVRITLGVCGGICLLLLVMAFAVGGGWRSVAPVVYSSLAVMAIAGGVCWLHMRLSEGGTQPYEMTPEHVRYVGTGRSNAYLDFKRMRRVRILEGQHLIELKTVLLFAPILVPPEDFSFVSNYIVQRLPDTAEVVYE